MSDKISRILNIVIAVLTVIIFCLSAYLFEQTRPDMNSRQPEPSKSMIRKLERGDYSGLVEDKYFNELSGVTVISDSSYKIPYAAADYYEAAFIYNACERTGDSTKALQYKKVMDEARTVLGDYEYLADEIDSFLGI